jgi:hypothetical protein
MSEHKQPRVKISGLWTHSTINAGRYLSGTTDGRRWSVFKNSFRTEGSNAPTHILYVENLPPKGDTKPDEMDAF